MPGANNNESLIQSNAAAWTFSDGTKEIVRILPNGDVIITGNVSDAAAMFWNAVSLHGKNLAAKVAELELENARLNAEVRKVR
jgi:hypothetical protein